MKANGLRVIAPQPRDHAEPLADLCGKVFSDLGYYEVLQDYRTVYLHNSHYDWETSRIGLLGDRIVSHFGVFGHQMRIGTARVRCAGVGAVATDAEFRKRGYMAQTATACIKAMREAGYDFSLLFGISDLYHRFGYTRAWSDTEFYVRTADLPKERLTGRLRKFKPRTRADLTALYNRHHAAVTGTAVRPTYRKGYPLWMRQDQGYAWLTGSGRVAGYVLARRDHGHIDCAEYCGDARRALRVLGLLARRWGCETVHFETLPYYSLLAKLLRRGNCRTETHYNRSGGAMMKLLNLHNTLTKIQGELSRRLRTSAVEDWEGSLLISDGREEAVLAIRKGKVAVTGPRRTRHAIRGDGRIAQLLLGTDQPGEVVEAANMRLTGDAGRLLPVLFPEQRPTLSALDRY